MTDSHASSDRQSSASSKSEDLPENNALTRLKDILDSDEDFEYLNSLSKNALSPAQKLLLSSLAKRFSPKRKRDDNDDDDQDPAAKRRNSRGPAPHHPWRRVLSMSSLTLDRPLQQYLDTFGSANPQGFFDDLSRLHQPAITTTHHHDTITAPATASASSSSAPDPHDPSGQGNAMGPPSKGAAFLALIRYTHLLTARMVQDRPRWLFLMLLYYDIAHLAFPDVRRFGSLALEDIRALLGGSVEEAAGEVLLLGGGGGRVNNANAHRGVRRDGDDAAASAAADGTSITLQQINEWTRCGQKCSEVCETFGEGALFYLGDIFSKDFLLHKFTSSGQYHDDAWEHLNDLDLKGAAISSGATELGEGIRRVLVAPFVLG